jgi:hypothetical protein
MPDRLEVINNLDVNTKAPLSTMQLWEVEDGPVVIERSGACRIFKNGRWQEMDSWEAIFEGTPMTYLMFAEKWPGLVPVDEYLGSFGSTQGVASRGGER